MSIATHTKKQKRPSPQHSGAKLHRQCLHTPTNPHTHKVMSLRAMPICEAISTPLPWIHCSNTNLLQNKSFNLARAVPRSQCTDPTSNYIRLTHVVAAQSATRQFQATQGSQTHVGVNGNSHRTHKKRPSSQHLGAKLDPQCLHTPTNPHTQKVASLRAMPICEAISTPLTLDTL